MSVKATPVETMERAMMPGTGIPVTVTWDTPEVIVRQV